MLETLFLGRPGLFHPRLWPSPKIGAADVSALYDLNPLRERLREFVDFGVLNSGAVRLSIATTDVVTGERVVFDTTAGPIGPEHVIASCALLPMFAPVEVDGRLLGDGCLSANTPLDLVLEGVDSGELVCFVVDLFAREGSRPHSLAAGLSRAGDLAFGNQTRSILEGRQREYRLRELIRRLGDALPPEMRNDPEIVSLLSESCPRQSTLVYLSYRAAPDEAGPAKGFDFSRATIVDRWRAGESDMREALASLEHVGGGRSAGLNIQIVPCRRDSRAR